MCMRKKEAVYELGRYQKKVKDLESIIKEQM